MINIHSSVHVAAEQVISGYRAIFNTQTLCFWSDCLALTRLRNHTLKLSFHYTANATTTTQKQSDYKVEQSSRQPNRFALT